MDDDRRFEAIAMDSDPMIQANGNNGDEEEQGDNELIEDDQEHEEQEEEEEEDEEDEEEWRRRPPLKILTFPAHAPIQGDTATFSSREPTTLVSAEETDVEMEVATAETPSPSIATTATTTTTTPNRTSDSTAVATTPGGSSEDRPSSNSSEESSLPGHQKRFLELQAFLKLCDEADQKDLLEALRSLSAAARSGHAFNLEYRALMLSMEEGREMLRLKMLNVMGGKGGSSPSQMTPSQQENGSTPVGSRLPAPGSVTDLSAC